MSSQRRAQEERWLQQWTRAAELAERVLCMCAFVPILQAGSEEERWRVLPAFAVFLGASARLQETAYAAAEAVLPVPSI